MVGMLWANRLSGRRGTALCVACATIVAGAPAGSLTAAEAGEVVAELMDFEDESAGASGPLSSFRWSTELDEWAPLLSGRERIEDPDSAGNHVLRLWVHDAFPWTSESDPAPEGFWLIEFYEVLSLLNGYIPPEADAVRMRVKPVRGQFEFCLWHIPLTMATGDVYTDFRVVHDVSAEEGWRDLVFPLNHELQRNLRRRDWSLDSPSITFTRWIQEVLHLSMIRPMGTPAAPIETAETDPELRSELLIDDVAFVNFGEGAPYLQVLEEPQGPGQIGPGEIEEVLVAADFEGGDTHGRGVTLTLQPGVIEGVAQDGEGGYLKPRYFYSSGNSGALDTNGDGRIDTAWHLPATLSEVQQGSEDSFPAGGQSSLRAVMKGYESQSWFGVEIPAATDANAVEILLRMSHSQPGLNPLVVDLLAYTTPVAERESFPHAALARPAWSPPEDVPADPAVWREVTATALIDGQSRVLQPLNFDYFLDHPRSRTMSGLSYAFYHARRVTTNGEWTRLVIPLADFQCAWGQRNSQSRFQLQQPLDSSELVLLVMTSPWRQLRRETEFLVDSVRLVRIPEEAAARRSFWQPPDVSVFDFRRDSRFVLHSGLRRQIRTDLAGEFPRLSLDPVEGGLVLSTGGPDGLRYRLEFSRDPGAAPWETIFIDRIWDGQENAYFLPAGEGGFFRGVVP